MAQTTTAAGPSNAVCEISTNGTTWTSLAGSMNLVDPDGQERQIGSANTFEGDSPVLGYGKLNPIKIKGRGLYTKTTNEAFETLRAIHETEGGAAIYVRYAPHGTAVGNQRFSTGKAFLSSFKYPSADASSADPIPFEFEVMAAKLTTETISA